MMQKVYKKQAKIQNLALIEIRKGCGMTVKSNLSKEEREILWKLKEDKSILIVPADKGRAVVVLDRDSYLEKMNEQLNEDYVEVA